MKIKKIKISPKVFLLDFPSQKTMAKTFLRFQEHYESLEFMGEVFTHKQFRKWYEKVKGKFSYYEDWDGFNLPASALKPFKEGKFNPLTKEEKALLALFAKERGNFYIISFYGAPHILAHELAHALFATNSGYKKRALKIIKKYNLSKFKRELIKEGYHHNVLNDEIQAYSVSLSHEIKIDIPINLIREMNSLFGEYCPKIY